MLFFMSDLLLLRAIHGAFFLNWLALLSLVLFNWLSLLFLLSFLLLDWEFDNFFFLLYSLYSLWDYLGAFHLQILAKVRFGDFFFLFGQLGCAVIIKPIISFIIEFDRYVRLIVSLKIWFFLVVLQFEGLVASRHVHKLQEEWVNIGESKGKHDSTSRVLEDIEASA